MAEKEYIEREAAIEAAIDAADEWDGGYNPHRAVQIRDGINAIHAADVRPVVTCERCVYHVDCGYHYCNKWCVNCPDDADFFCAYGEES